MTAAPRHDAKYSPNVVDRLRSILNDPGAPVAGPLFDPFAGVGVQLGGLGRDDVTGIELEPEFVGPWGPLVSVGDAFDPSAYPFDVGAVVTSPCYGNRFADQYLGPKCPACSGSGLALAGAVDVDTCSSCSGTGHDGRGRFGYAISLGRKVSDGSGAALQWGPKYRAFHDRWLRLISDLLPAGGRRLILNMSDHERKGARAYVCHWWIEAAGRHGFRLVEAHAVDTGRFGYGSNQQNKAESEMVLVFDLLERKRNA